MKKHHWLIAKTDSLKYMSLTFKNGDSCFIKEFDRNTYAYKVAAEKRPNQWGYWTKEQLPSYFKWDKDRILEETDY